MSGHSRNRLNNYCLILADDTFLPMAIALSDRMTASSSKASIHASRSHIRSKFVSGHISPLAAHGDMLITSGR